MLARILKYFSFLVIKFPFILRRLGYLFLDRLLFWLQNHPFSGSVLQLGNPIKRPSFWKPQQRGFQFQYNTKNGILTILSMRTSHWIIGFLWFDNMMSCGMTNVVIFRAFKTFLNSVSSKEWIRSFSN